RSQPCDGFRSKIRMDEGKGFIRGKIVGRGFENLPVLISCNRGRSRVLLKKRVRGQWIERTIENISKVHESRNLSLPDILQNGIERPRVAMNVCDHCKFFRHVPRRRCFFCEPHGSKG